MVTTQGPQDPQEQPMAAPAEKSDPDMAISDRPESLPEGEELTWDAMQRDVPWIFKWVAFACVVCFPMGSTWTESSLGPLKNTLREELGINNTQFGIISSADSFINSIFPIIGGMLLDWWGPNPITLTCTGIITVGSFISAVGIQQSLWRVLVGGHILMGFGVALLDSAQQKFMYHWFGPSGYALAFGLENAISSTIGLLSGMTAIPIRDGTGWYGWTFWVPAFFCAFSFLTNIAYVLFERFYIKPQYRLSSGRARAIAQTYNIKSSRIFSLDTLTQLPWQYLMLPGTQLLQSGAADSFNVSAADMIRMKGFEEDVAGYLATGQKVVKILASPLLGWGMDKYGHRFHLVALAPIMWIIANVLIGFTDVHPIAALVFSAIANTINAMPLQICLAMLVADEKKLGTAFGIWRAANNSAGIIMDVAFGRLQDSTPGMGYSEVLKLGMSLKAWAFALGIAYLIVDYKKLGRGMTMTRKQREKREAEITDRDSDPLTRRNVWLPMTIWTFSAIVALIITSWTLFIMYLI